MISKKMKEYVTGSSLIRAMFEDSQKLASIYGAENVYDFSLGNPCFPPAGALKNAMMEILNMEDQCAVHGYMNNAGHEAVRQSIADSLNRRFGTEFSARNIIMTVGAAGGINVALKTLIDPGDENSIFTVLRRIRQLCFQCFRQTGGGSMQERGFHAGYRWFASGADSENKGQNGQT